MDQPQAFTGGPLWQQFQNQFTEPRRLRMLEVSAKRSFYLQLVLQDTHYPHNVAACLRSADAFGVHKVHLINAKRRARTSSASRGSSKWLDLEKHAEINDCVQRLKERGFRIAAAMPSPAHSTKPTMSLMQLPVDQPLALVFGNERVGLDPQWLPGIDYFFTIPMTGMVESLNISVAVAISLFAMTEQCQRLVADSVYFVSAAERGEILDKWVTKELYL